MHALNRLLCIALLASLAACASAPSRYYSLSETRPDAVPPKPSPAYGVRIDTVRVPAEVDRSQLLVRRQADDAPVEVLSESLWTAPLSDQLQATLAEQVAARLGVPDLTGVAAPADLPVRRLGVQVTRFDLVFDDRAMLAANWSVAASPGAPADQVCSARLAVPAAGADIEALVQAQRQAVALLAAIMAHHLEPATPAPQDAAIQFARCV